MIVVTFEGDFDDCSHLLCSWWVGHVAWVCLLWVFWDVVCVDMRVD